MKKILTICIFLLFVASGCIPVTTQMPNEPPVAYIDSILPDKITLGDHIFLVGHGTDKEGDIVAYEWRSSIDGILSNMSSFGISTLSAGKHLIYFRVQDNKGDWSKDVYIVLTVVPKEITKPFIKMFSVKPDAILLGESAILNWEVNNASKVLITPDIGNVPFSGNRVIYPKADSKYIIIASNDMGQVSAEVKVSVITKKVKALELISIADEDGTVRRDMIIEPDLMAGENTSSTPMQAFLSFDISMIPVNAVIEEVFLDISYHSTYGYPFNFLGAMGIFHHQYGSLDLSDYVIGFPQSALYKVYTEPWQAYESNNLIKDAVQQQVNKGSSRFQIRIQFEKYYYAGGKANYIGLTSDKVKLIVKYTE